MPVFKTPEQEQAQQSLETLKIIKNVATRNEFSPVITQPQAQEFYQKYEKTINTLISLGSTFAAAQQSAQKSEEAAGRNLELQTKAVEYGTKATVALGAIGMVLSGGYLIKPSEIKGAWKGAEEFTQDIRRSGEKMEAATDKFQASMTNLYSAYSGMVDSLVSGSEAGVQKSYGSLNKALNGMQSSYASMDAAASTMGEQSRYLQGAMGVLKSFSAEVAITIATMGAAEIGTHLALKGAARLISSIPTIEVLGVAETAAASASTLSTVTGTAATIVPKAQKAYKFVAKPGYEVWHAEHKLASELVENYENAKQLAPR